MKRLKIKASVLIYFPFYGPRVFITVSSDFMRGSLEMHSLHVVNVDGSEVNPQGDRMKSYFWVGWLPAVLIEVRKVPRPHRWRHRRAILLRWDAFDYPVVRFPPLLIHLPR